MLPVLFLSVPVVHDFMLFVLFLLLLFVCFQVASPQVIAREGEGARGLKQAHVGSEAFSNSGKRPNVSRLFHFLPWSTQSSYCNQNTTDLFQR